MYKGEGSNPADALPLEVALDSAEVSFNDYEEVRQRLIQIGLVRFVSEGNQKIFIIEGFLDNYLGLIYSPNGIDVPELGEYAPHGEIIYLSKVACDWWIYSTT